MNRSAFCRRACAAASFVALSVAPGLLVAETADEFGAMLAKGASQPWQDSFYELTGTRQMDASAIMEYFEPLRGWLAEQNKGQQCGW